ncbi:Terpene cyclase atmB [Paramyrothecium foliicola]|nr:Terpene cyclase atmB [Paramyrothecium foliicola]
MSTLANAPDNLVGKTCLITGGAGGLGKAIAAAFLEAGANVIICDIREDRVQQASVELAGKGSLTAVTADITSPGSMQDLFSTIAARFGTLHVLINNAAIMDRFEPVGDVGLELWNQVLAVNLTAPLFLSKLAIGSMLQDPISNGCIINIASGAAKAGWLAGAAYTASKHGLIGLTKSTAAFYSNKGIRCNALMLGVIGSTYISDAFRDDCHSEGRQKVGEILTGHRPQALDVKDVGALCVSLTCGQGWNAVNGGLIAVDHGWTSVAPSEFLEVAWIAQTCKLLMGIGWTTNYIGMIYKSLKDQTYSMALMPLCCNFAWELTYALIYPFNSNLEMWVHYTGLALNCGVMYTAIKNAPREWQHSPLVQRNLPFIFVICIAGWTSAHVAVATQIGPSLAQAWTAYGCQLLLSVGGLCQLLSRGHSRGTSFFLW